MEFIKSNQEEDKLSFESNAYEFFMR